MQLSIIIPVYNEVHKISADIASAAKLFLDQALEGEIIVVDDGSGDETAAAAEKTIVPAPVTLRIERYKQNRGKGYALRRGVALSHGEIVMFADSGNCVPYSDALQGMEMIRQGHCEIAHGSRKMPDSDIQKPRNLYRRFCSWLFRRLMLHLMNVPDSFTDTQCGFKVYRGDVARQIFGECFTDGFMIDIEVLLRARKHGYRIKEFPVHWSCDPDSRLHPVRTSWRNIKELWKIRQALRGK